MLYEEYIPEIKDEIAWKQYKIFIEGRKKIKIPGLLFDYTAKHHIIPKCFLKTSKEKEDQRNIVVLSFTDHKEAHRLLAQAFQTTGLILAYNMMNKQPIEDEFGKLRTNLGIERLRQLKALNGGVYHTEKYLKKKAMKEAARKTEELPCVASKEIKLLKKEESFDARADWLDWLASVWKG